MKTVTLYRSTFRLGALSAVSLVLAALALTDISHGERDVSLEWGMVRVALVIITAFHIAGLFGLRRAMKRAIADDSRTADARA